MRHSDKQPAKGKDSANLAAKLQACVRTQFELSEALKALGLPMLQDITDEFFGLTLAAILADEKAFDLIFNSQAMKCLPVKVRMEFIKFHSEKIKPSCN